MPGRADVSSGGIMNFPRRRLLQLIGAAAAAPALAEFAYALDYPTRPIRFIVPYPPGGATDVAARVIGEYLSRVLGQHVVVENKSGGGSLVGIESAAKSTPDGYTVLVTTDIIASAPHTFKMSIDPLKALAPVIQLSHQPVVLTVHPALGVNTLDEFIALAKQQPGLSFATSGVGTQQHIAAEWFTSLAGIKLAHVPYRGGAPALNDLIGGHVRSEEHTSELQSRSDLVCRLLLEKKKRQTDHQNKTDQFIVELTRDDN